MSTLEIHVTASSRQRFCFKDQGGRILRKERTAGVMTSCKAQPQSMPVSYHIKQRKKTQAGRNPISNLHYERIPILFSYKGTLLSQISIIKEIRIYTELHEKQHAPPGEDRTSTHTVRHRHHLAVHEHLRSTFCNENPGKVFPELPSVLLCHSTEDRS